ncbi:ATP-binding protein [Streptomyces sp. NBC_00076]
MRGVDGVDGTPGPHPAPVEAVIPLTLPGHDRASARAARRHVRDTTRSWGLPSRATDDLETIAGELVANAVEHSGSHTITVTCALSAGSATISVTDEGGGTRMPMAPAVPPPPDQEHGRGLLITDALADRWGTRRAGGELTVWAEVSLESLE